MKARTLSIALLTAACGGSATTPSPDATAPPPDGTPPTCHLAPLDTERVQAIAFDPPDTIYYAVEQTSGAMIYKQVGDAAPDTSWLPVNDVRAMTIVGRTLYYIGADATPGAGSLYMVNEVDLDAPPQIHALKLPGYLGPYGPAALAVGDDGTLYLPAGPAANGAATQIYARAPGEPAWHAVSAPIGTMSGIAIDPSGALYVELDFGRELWRIDRGADGMETGRARIAALPTGYAGGIDYGLVRDAQGRLVTTVEGADAVLRVSIEPPAIAAADHVFVGRILSPPAIGTGCWSDAIYVGSNGGVQILDGGAFTAR